MNLHHDKTKGLLVPLRLDPVELPRGFGLIQEPDLSEWKNNTHDSEFLQLMDAVAETDVSVTIIDQPEIKALRIA